jgi:alkylhydroperoxidase family enzyme
VLQSDGDTLIRRANTRARATGFEYPTIGATKAVVQDRGHLSDAQVQTVRAAGFSDAEVLELIASVVANIFTNYVNNIAATVVDFPLVLTTEVKVAA